MTQHYLRSAAYRDFSIHSIYGMSDDDIHAMFARLRWSSDSHQACPACGAWAQHYRRPARQQWRCKECGRDFSVTSATAFSSRKKSLRSILLATFYYVTGVKGLAGLGLSRMGDYSNKAAHVALGKLREAIFRPRTSHRSPASLKSMAATSVESLESQIVVDSATTRPLSIGSPDAWPNAHGTPAA